MQDRWEMIKHSMAATAAVGELLLFLTTRLVSYLTLLKLLLALVVLFWGWFERHNGRPFVKSLARVAVLYGAIFTAHAVASFVILALLQTPNPRLWAARAPVAHEASFTLRRQGGRYVGTYRPQLNRDADLAEIMILPAAPDAARVGEVEIGRIDIAPADRQNVREVREGEDDTRLSVEVVAPNANYNFVLHLAADAQGDGQPPPEVRMLAQYKYVRRDSTWRLREWVHDRFGR